MKICEMCNVLFNMSLGLDYADGADSNKEELDILETEGHGLIGARKQILIPC